MRVLDILTTVLLAAGVLGSVIPRVQDRNRSQLGNGTVPILQNIPRAMVFRDSEVSSEKSDRSIKAVCENAGGPAAYDAMVEGLRSSFVCMTLNASQLKHDIRNVASDKKWDVFLGKYCPKIPYLRECEESFDNALEPCLKSEEDKRVAVGYKNAVIPVLEFLCVGDGARTAFFINAGGVQCLAVKKNAIEICADKAFGDYSKVDIQKYLKPDLQEVEECNNVEKFRACVITAMQSCELYAMSPAVLDYVFDFLTNITSCRSYLEEQATTPASQTHQMPTTPRGNVSSMAEGYENSLKQKCKKNGGPEAYEALIESTPIILGSVGLLLNISQLSAEVDAALLNGRPDIISKKYCRRLPILRELVNYRIDLVTACLDPEERSTIDKLYRIDRLAMDSLCDDGGHRINTFLTAGNAECFLSKSQAMIDCARQSFGVYTANPDAFGEGSEELGDSTMIPVMNETKICNNLEKFRNCSVRVLEECENKTTSNLVASFLDSISDEIPCGNPIGEEAPPGQSTEIPSSAIAPKSISSPEERLPGEFVLELHVPPNDSVSSSAMDEDVEEYRQRAECARNGGYIPYHIAKLISEPTVRIMEDSVRDILHTYPGKFGEVRNNLTVFESYCHQLPALVQRYQNIANSTKPCMSRKDRDELDVILNGMNVFMEYICENDGARLEGLITRASSKCLSTRDKALQNCGDVDSERGHPRIYRMFINRCTDRPRLKNCILGILNECEDHTLADVAGFLMDHVGKISPCENLMSDQVPPDTDGPSSISVIDYEDDLFDTEIPPI